MPITRRALCLLDPYNINLKWEVIETAGKMGSVEVFLNFMIMDINAMPCGKTGTRPSRARSINLRGCGAMTPGRMLRTAAKADYLKIPEGFK